MNEKTHDLKTAPEFFQQVWDEDKLFSIRENDRDFQVGDTLLKREYKDGDYTGRYIQAKVTSMVTAEEFPQGLQPGYCVLSIKRFAYGNNYQDLTPMQDGGSPVPKLEIVDRRER